MMIKGVEIDKVNMDLNLKIGIDRTPWPQQV